MYQRGKLFYADYYDATGKRVRMSFTTEEAAKHHEDTNRAKAVRSKLKNHRAESRLPRVSAPTPSKPGKTTTTKRTPQKPSSPRAAAKRPIK